MSSNSLSLILLAVAVVVVGGIIALASSRRRASVDREHIARMEARDANFPTLDAGTPER